MTKTEAIEAMKAGKKVIHRYFSEHEFITMDGPNFIDHYFDIDWEIFTPKN